MQKQYTRTNIAVETWNQPERQTCV